MVYELKDTAKCGRGMVIMKAGEIVAGASSYTRYKEGIEIEVDTVEAERRKHLDIIRKYSGRGSAGYDKPDGNFGCGQHCSDSELLLELQRQ